MNSLYTIFCIDTPGMGVSEPAWQSEYSIGLLLVWLLPGMLTDADSGEYSVGLLQVWLLPGMLTANVLAAALLNLWIFVPLGPSAAAGIVTSTS